MTQTARRSWQVAIRFGLGAAVALAGALSSLAMLARWRWPGAALGGQLMLLLFALITAGWFFAGGELVGGVLRPSGRGRLGLGVVFLLAGPCLTIWLLAPWISRDAPWGVFLIQGLGCAVIWTLAGFAGGLVWRHESASLAAAIVGFGVGGLAGGFCLTGGLMVLSLRSDPIGQAGFLTAVLLVGVLPPFVAGALLGRWPGGINLAAGSDPV